MPEQGLKAWRFLNTAFGSAFFNMATDEALVHSVASGRSAPTVRLFGWKPAAVSFGYAQKIGREIDVNEATRQGIDIVRRPTGGRAVLHWNELTYSVIVPADHPIMGGNISAVYRAVSECLVAGLRILDIDANLEPGRSPTPSPSGKDLTSPCFSSTSQYEITLGGKKLVGSAQRRMGEIVLQHGSLLIGPEHKQIVNLMPAGHDRLKSAYTQQLETHTVSLHEGGHPYIDFNTVAAGIQQGFQVTLGTELKDEPLSKHEKDGIETLVTTKYGTPDWNEGDMSAEVTRRILP
jgi:lipoate-protein ligase A